MNSEQLQFYTSPLCPYCIPVEYLLEKEKVNFKKNLINLMKGENETEEYKKINPFQRVPAIVDGDFILFESNTLLKYVCNSRQVSDHWYPKDPKKRALVDLYVDFHLQNIWNMGRYTYVNLGYAKDTLEEATKIADSAFQQLESIFLSKTKFITSDEEISIADLALVWHLASLVSFGFQLRPRVQQFYNDILSTDPEGFKQKIDNFLSERDSAMKDRIQNKK